MPSINDDFFYSTTPDVTVLPAERAEHDNFASLRTSFFNQGRVAAHCSNTELSFRRLDAGFEVRSARSPSSSDSLSVPSMGRLDGNILLKQLAELSGNSMTCVTLSIRLRMPDGVRARAKTRFAGGT